MTDDRENRGTNLLIQELYSETATRNAMAYG